MHTTRVSRHHVTAIVSAICVAIVLAPIVAAAGGPTANTVTKVKGTVDVGNLPAVQKVAGSVTVENLPATQSVSGSVNVGNLPSTQNVAGTVTADPGFPGTPFTKLVVSSNSVPSFTVPSGHSLVIQSVSAHIGITSGDRFELSLGYETNGQEGVLFIPATLAYTVGGDDYYIANITTDIYADPGSPVYLEASAVAGTVVDDELDVSGYETS
jgi:hypothetical protein